MAKRSALKKRKVSARTVYKAKLKPRTVSKDAPGLSPAITTLMEEGEVLRDEITGRKRKASPLHVLNKKKVSKWELDELFAGDEIN